MLAQRNPHTVYRSIDFNARVASATPGELVKLCYEQVISALGRALIAEQRRDNGMKSEALTRAVSALTALQMGISADNSVADALNHIYTTARRAVLDSVLRFDAGTISQIREDFVEISAAMAG